ncbi:lysosome-associated membrane glycoprotein 1-like [Branchiostoma lanceolatum]|uniref:lysosome-associated membrane glycoprotein 1-like n=1 Tax=Branchiostoma lanceolatum TaxID=7740 RepID=UPI0034556F9A
MSWLTASALFVFVFCIEATSHRGNVGSSPSQGHFEVKDNTTGQICLIAEMGLQFRILYTKNDGKFGTGVFSLPQSVNTTGFCGSNDSSLTLMFHDDTFNVTFDFVKSVKGGSVSRFHVSTIEISYTELPSIFPGTKSPDARRHVSNDTMNIFSADADKSYMCNTDVNITVTKDVSIIARQVQLQPFGVKSGKFSSAQVCSQDTGNKSSFNIAAIVIGVIAGLALLGGVFAYVVFSERKRQDYHSLNSD